MRLIAILGLAVACCPAAAADAQLHGWFSPVTDERTIAAGSDDTVPWTWNVAFENTTCTAAVEVGVDFIVESSPSWAGADFEPDGAQTKYPGGTGSVAVQVFVDPDASSGAVGTLSLVLVLNPYNAAGACSPVPRITTDDATLVVRAGPGTAATHDSPTSGAPSQRRDTPGFEAVALAAAVVVAYLLRR